MGGSSLSCPAVKLTHTTNMADNRSRNDRTQLNLVRALAPTLETRERERTHVQRETLTKEDNK